MVLKNYSEARKRGIGVVYQELLCCLRHHRREFHHGRGPGPKGDDRFDDSECTGQEDHGDGQPDLDPSELIKGLPVAVRQMVEIGKVLSQDPKLIIFDEPTASLSKDEVRLLFGIIRDLKARGKAIIYISHRLEEVFELADRVTVMKDGKRVATEQVGAFTEDTLISKMVGRELKDIFPPKLSKGQAGAVKFSATVKYDQNHEPISFEIREGEILGFGGLQGQGQIRCSSPSSGCDGSRNFRSPSMASRARSGILGMP